MKIKFSLLTPPVPLLKGGYFKQLRQFLKFSLRRKCIYIHMHLYMYSCLYLRLGSVFSFCHLIRHQCLPTSALAVLCHTT